MQRVTPDEGIEHEPRVEEVVVGLSHRVEPGVERRVRPHDLHASDVLGHDPVEALVKPLEV